MGTDICTHRLDKRLGYRAVATCCLELLFAFGFVVLQMWTGFCHNGSKMYQMINVVPASTAVFSYAWRVGGWVSVLQRANPEASRLPAVPWVAFVGIGLVCIRELDECVGESDSEG